jgi:hypothetical protein
MKKLLLLLPVVALLLTGCWVTTTDGEHTGFVTAVEKNGAFWKTGRVYIKSDLSSSQEDIYCVENQEVFNSLKDKSVNKEKVTVVFHDEAAVAPWRCGGEMGIIDSIK